jgi:RHS repeat-associated protein
MVPYYYHSNSTGNVTAITDNSGALVERVDYDIYGMPTFTDYKTDPQNPTMVSNSLIGNSYLFHGRRYDSETNLYYYRARYYDPITGRFLSTDPMGYADSMNLYQAFKMNGFNYVDPWGTIANPLIDPRVSKSAYVKFIRAFRTHYKAMQMMYKYKYAIKTGASNTRSVNDDLYEMGLGSSPILDRGKKVLEVMATLDTAIIGGVAASSVKWVDLAVKGYNVAAASMTKSLVTSTVVYNIYRGKEVINKGIEIVKSISGVIEKAKDLLYKARVYYDTVLDSKIGGIFKSLFEKELKLDLTKSISSDQIGFFVRKVVEGFFESKIPDRPPNLHTTGENIGYMLGSSENVIESIKTIFERILNFFR